MTRPSRSSDDEPDLDVSTRVEGILRDRMGLEVPGRDADLLATGVLDSLALVDLVMHLERTFGNPIPLVDVDLDELRTVHGIARLVAERRNGR